MNNHQSSPLYDGLKQTISPLSQGLYMKHLLKHLTTPNLTISEIFARLYSSFTQGCFYSYCNLKIVEENICTQVFLSNFVLESLYIKELLKWYGFKVKWLWMLQEGATKVCSLASLWYWNPFKSFGRTNCFDCILGNRY